MSKLSQKELLSEGFLSTVRNLARGGAKVLGGAIGGVAGAAKQVARDVATADTNASIFGVVGQGIKGAAKGYKTEAEKQLNFSPDLFVENELKTKWASVFDPNTIKITKTISAAPYEHRSFKLSRYNRLFVYFEANKYIAEGGIKKVKYYAIVTRGVDKKFKFEGIRDENGNMVTDSTTSKVKNYDREISPFLTRIPNPNAPLLNDYAKVITNAFKLNKSQIQMIADTDSITTVPDLLMALTNKGSRDTLDQNDIAEIKRHFKENLIAEKSQINLLKQLKLLNDSYNKTYELSKH